MLCHGFIIKKRIGGMEEEKVYKLSMTSTPDWCRDENVSKSFN